MANFNKKRKNSAKTTNRNGHSAYAMKDKDRLVAAVLTTFLSGDKYYGDTKENIIKDATNLCKHGNTEFVAKLAVYARKEFNMRSISHLLTAIVCKENGLYTNRLIKNVVVRVDDMTEILACYRRLYPENKITLAMKKALGEKIQDFDEYSLAKYNRSGEFTLKRIVLMSHPQPKTAGNSKLLKKILNDDLKTPYTWETELSKRGNTKEVWDELISSGDVGYMALLRNLRNIIMSGADYRPVLNTLSDKYEVLKSKQLPFRFFSAYKMIDEAHIPTVEVYKALEKAIRYSIENAMCIPGKSMIAVDCSASMSWCRSSKSKITPFEIGLLLGIMCATLCDECEIVLFNNQGKIINFNKSDNILDKVKQFNANGGTDVTIPFKIALDEIMNNKSFVPYDRFIILSDNEMNASYNLYNCQSYFNNYRNMYNKNCWVHGIDIEGYGTQQFCGKNFNLIAGWSEKVLDFIYLAEDGNINLIKTIEAYKLK